MKHANHFDLVVAHAIEDQIFAMNAAADPTIPALGHDRPCERPFAQIKTFPLQLIDKTVGTRRVVLRDIAADADEIGLGCICDNDGQRPFWIHLAAMARRIFLKA